MSKIADVIEFLESIAPLEYQESYDNAGLLTGDAGDEVKGVIVCLDTVEAVVDEAIEKGCNLIVSHHPVIFGGLKSLTGKNYVERTVIRAIRHGIAIYAIHTNLDNVLTNGVNERIAERLGLENCSILRPKRQEYAAEIPVSALLAEEVVKAMRKLEVDNGATSIQCRLVNTADPNRQIAKVRFTKHLFGQVHEICEHYRLEHNYWPIEGKSPSVGSGLVGELALPVAEKEFFALLRDKMKAKVIRHTATLGRSVSKVAICGGSGSFLLKDAIGAGADAFVTGDFKYHQFFDAEARILIADIGHYESEQFTIDLLLELIREKFRNFAARSTEVNTNPVFYY